MNIIFATPSPFPYYSGGVETWMYNVLKRMADNNVLHIVAPSFHTQGLVFKDLPSTIKIWNYKCLKDNRIFQTILKGRLGYIDNKYRQGTFEKTMSDVIEHFSSNEKVFIFCVDPIFLGPIVIKLKKKYKNIVYICSIRGPHLDIISKTYPLFKREFVKNEKKSVCNSDIVFANGYDTKNLYDARYGINCNILKNGVDITKIQNELSSAAIEMKDSENSILSVATLIPIKGVYFLLDAMNSYHKKYGDDFKLYYIGKGDQNRLLTLAEKYGISQNVICLGHRDNPIPYMKKTKINACVSGGGGFSMSMLEAMASGNPVVAIDTPLYRQFNKYHQIPLTPEGDEDALADMIRDIFNNYEDYKKNTQKSQLVAEEFDWKTVVKQLETYLLEYLAKTEKTSERSNEV